MTNSRKRIDELAKIEFVGAREITLYAKTGRELLKDFTRELEFSADEFEAIMRETARHGHPLLFGMDVKWKARRVAARLRRAADATNDAAAEVVRFHAGFRREFAAALNPPKPSKKQFNFQND